MISSVEDIERRSESLLVVPISVKTHKLSALMDSGAIDNFMSEDATNLLGVKRESVREGHPGAQLGNGDRVECLSTLKVRVRIKFMRVACEL